MRPKERRDSGQSDLFRARLDQIIDLGHPLVKLAGDDRLGLPGGAVRRGLHRQPGHPPLPTRLMAGLAILKHMHDLSDEALCARWVENPYFQFFCGEEFFQHKLAVRPLVADALAPADGRGEARSADPGEPGDRRRAPARPSRADFSSVIVDTTVQPKEVMFPTDAQLMHRARERLVRLAKKTGVRLRQSYERVGKFALIKHQRYAHAKQFKRANRALRTLRTYLGRVIRDIGRKIRRRGRLETRLRADLLLLARRVREQRQHQRGQKVYSLHAPEVECIGKGKAHRPYEFGVKVSVATTLASLKGGQFVAHVKALPGNPYDGHTLATVIPDIEAQIGATLDASSPTAAIAATTPRPSTSSRSTSPARSAASPKRSSANCDADPPSSPSSATSKPSTAWAATISLAPHGDAINAVLAAAGYNFRRLLAWLAAIWRAIIAVIFAGMKLPPIAQPA